MPPSLREGDHDSGGRSQFASISEGVDQIVVEGVYSLSHFVTAPSKKEPVFLASIPEVSFYPCIFYHFFSVVAI